MQQKWQFSVFFDKKNGLGPLGVKPLCQEYRKYGIFFLLYFSNFIQVRGRGLPYLFYYSKYKKQIKNTIKNIIKCFFISQTITI